MRTKVKPNLDWLLDVDLTPDLKKAQATVTVKNVPAKRENTSRPVIPKGPPATMQELEAIGIKPIPALRNLYATKDGRVFSLKTGNPVELTQRINRDGYPTVTVKSKEFFGTQCVHKLVLEAFVGPKPENMECRHLNDIKTDNHLDNLKWGTSLENSQDIAKNGNPRIANGDPRKLNDELVATLKMDHRAGHSTYSLSEKYSVSRRTVRDILQGKLWRHVS